MKCRICGGKCLLGTFGRDIWAGGDERHEYATCSNCGCVQIVNYPPDLSPYYAETYYSFNVYDGASGSFKQKLIKFRDSYAVEGRGLIGWALSQKFPTLQFTSISKPGIAKDSAILDVGCGDGALLRGLYELGFSNLLGIDPYGKSERVGAGLEFMDCDIYQISNIFDVIIMKGTLEHQVDQLKLMCHANKLLPEGGRCIVRIPVSDSYAYENYGVDWVQFDAPRHLYLHTLKSMEVLALQSGFDIIRHWDDSSFLQIIGSEQLKKGIYLGDSSSILQDKAASAFSDSDLRTFRSLDRSVRQQGLGDTRLFELKKTS